jgi:hypothetical protein
MSLDKASRPTEIQRASGVCRLDLGKHLATKSVGNDDRSASCLLSSTAASIVQYQKALDCRASLHSPLLQPAPRLQDVIGILIMGDGRLGGALYQSAHLGVKAHLGHPAEMNMFLCYRQYATL